MIRIFKVANIVILILILVFIGCQKSIPVTMVTIENKLDLRRPVEIVELSLADLPANLQSIPVENIAVVNESDGNNLPSQLIDLDSDGKSDQLIFMVDFDPEEVKRILIYNEKLPSSNKAESKVYARFVPERFDDFAWENDRIAFRMYGPALQAKGEISSGVDVWVKSVRDLVIDKWYKLDDYHADHGEGLDYYKVGPSRGCGGLAVVDDGKIVVSKNFTNWKIIANGPLRTIFELNYASLDIDGKSVTETKRITLDAGSNLNRFESTFTGDDLNELLCAAGIVQRDEPGVFTADKITGIMSYWEPPHPEHGSIGCGIVCDPKIVADISRKDGHYWMQLNATIEKAVVYYAGACWSKGLDFNDADEWKVYLNNFSRRLLSPLNVKIQK